MTINSLLSNDRNNLLFIDTRPTDRDCRLNDQNPISNGYRSVLNELTDIQAYTISIISYIVRLTSVEYPYSAKKVNIVIDAR